MSIFRKTDKQPDVPYQSPVIDLPPEQLEALCSGTCVLLHFSEPVLDVTLRNPVPFDMLGLPARAEWAFNKYLRNVSAWLEDVQVLNPITKGEEDPDEAFMREIEENAIPRISHGIKDIFRQGVFIRMGMAAHRGETLNYKTDPTLQHAIERYLGLP